jgi:hypothetical protein
MGPDIFPVRKRRDTHLKRDARYVSEGFVHVQYFLSQSSGIADQQCPVGPRTASNCARVVGGRPRSLPILVNLCAYPG